MHGDPRAAQVIGDRTDGKVRPVVDEQRHAGKERQRKEHDEHRGDRREDEYGEDDREFEEDGDVAAERRRCCGRSTR